MKIIRNLGKSLKVIGYGHVYMEGPGDHEWPYWDKMIQRAIQFFLNLDLQTTELY